MHPMVGHNLHYDRVWAKLCNDVAGLCVSFYGPIEGSRHDSTLLRQSGLMAYLSEDEQLADTDLLMYGDPAYSVNRFLCSPFKGNALTFPQRRFNTVMSGVRVSIEWFFGILKRVWAHIDWHKKHQLELSPIADLINVAVLLTNCNTCVRGGNQISDFFRCPPPTIEDYLTK